MRIQNDPGTFWDHVRTGFPDQCWPWTGATHNGYGYYSREKKTQTAHRIAWELTHQQQIPDGLVIRHRCDNPPCCNPSHLIVGTRHDNSRDMAERQRSGAIGRMPRGSAHPLAILNEEQVRMIRVAAASGESYASLGRRFGINPVGIRHIVVRKTWKHVD
jgi:hypothetical protein